jgi:lipopolysaccharide transport system ATP-binding protein
MSPGENHLVCSFPKGFFNSGTFYLTLFIISDKTNGALIERAVISFTVVDGSREMGVYMGREPGYIKPAFHWKNAITA